VGSSARITFGLATTARDTPTNCCWPGRSKFVAGGYAEGQNQASKSTPLVGKTVPLLPLLATVVDEVPELASA
jgi:hypothetical protein